MRLFVLHIPSEATEEEVGELFGQYGLVEGVRIILDRATRLSRCIAFVEMATADDAEAAIAGLHRAVWRDRKLVVEKARPSGPRIGDEKASGGVPPK